MEKCVNLTLPVLIHLKLYGRYWLCQISHSYKYMTILQIYGFSLPSNAARYIVMWSNAACTLTSLLLKKLWSIYLQSLTNIKCLPLISLQCHMLLCEPLFLNKIFADVNMYHLCITSEKKCSPRWVWLWECMYLCYSPRCDHMPASKIHEWNWSWQMMDLWVEVKPHTHTYLKGRTQILTDNEWSFTAGWTCGIAQRRLTICFHCT